MSRNRVLGSPYEQQVITGGNFQTEPSVDRYLIDNTSGATIAVVLDPNAFNGDQVMIADVNGNAAGFPISVTYHGSPVATIGTAFGSLELTFSFDLGKWTYVVGSQSDSALAVNTVFNRTTTLATPAIPFNVPVADGAGATVMQRTISPSDPTSGFQSTAISVHGYVGFKNTATAVRQITVNIEETLGTPLYTTTVTLPAASGGVDSFVTVPFDGDVPFTSQTTTVFITAVDVTAGATGTDVVVPALGSNMVLQEVSAGML